MLLRGFQITERNVCAWINLINADLPSTDGVLDVSSSDVTLTDTPLHPKSRFRAAVLVIIAVERMKIIVRNWRHLALIPSSEEFDFEIQSVLTSATSPGKNNKFSIFSANTVVIYHTVKFLFHIHILHPTLLLRKSQLKK